VRYGMKYQLISYGLNTLRTKVRVGVAVTKLERNNATETVLLPIRPPLN
jgi:hypothetical protein